MLAMVFVYSCRYGLRPGGKCAGGEEDHMGARPAVFGSTGKRPQKSFRVTSRRRGGVGGVGSPRKCPREPLGRGVGAPPGSTRKRNKKATSALQCTPSGQRDVDSRSADGRMLLRAQRDVLWPGRSTFDV